MLLSSKVKSISPRHQVARRYSRTLRRVGPVLVFAGYSLYNTHDLALTQFSKRTLSHSANSGTHIKAYGRTYQSLFATLMRDM